MKPSFVFMTVLAILTMLVAGCAVPEVTAPAPTPETPAPPSAPAPEETIQPPGPAISTGTIEVRVTDAPPEYDITSIMVTVSEEEGGIEVHKVIAEQVPEQQGSDNQTQEQDEEQQGEGGWITIPITGTNPFDLLQLQGIEEVLGTSNMTAGKYTQIRMAIEMVEVTYTSLKGGVAENTTVEATLPGGKLKFVRPFDVVEGETTILLLDFDAEKFVTVTGQGKVIVKPVVKLTIQQGKPHQLDSIEGTISEVDTEAATVSIIPADATEPLVLDVNPQTEITLDGEEATLEDLAGLAEGTSATASYYLDNFKAVKIDALSP